MNIYSHTPYTYLIGWSSLNKWYYGVRYSRKCHPDDLWSTYFTSSKKVDELRKTFGEPDVIQIRKTFNDVSKAIAWEEKVLRRLEVLKEERWLNMNVAGAIAPMPGNLNPRYGKSKSAEEISKIRNANLGKKLSEKTKQKQSLAKKGNPGIPHTDQTKQLLSSLKKGKYLGKDNPFYGHNHSKETKQYLRDLRKGKTYEEIYNKETAERTRLATKIRMTGSNHHFFGTSVSEDRKAKIRNTLKTSNPTVTCIRCKKNMGIQNFIRWHLNRPCKVDDLPGINGRFCDSL
jgi:hypothetical protein